MKKALLFLTLTIVLLICLTSCHNHSFGEWTTTTEPTCEGWGEQHRYCSCGESDTRAIMPTGHDWGEINCTTPKTCVNCNATEGSAPGHSFGEWQITKFAGCEDGEMTRTCSICKFDEHSVIDAIYEHTIVIDSGYPATCSSEGLTEGSHCTSCNKVMKVQVTLPKIDHILSNVVAEEEYCGEHQVSSIYCSECGEYVTSYGHHYIKTVIQATCTTDGEIRYTCDKCGDTYYNVTPASGHIESAYETVAKATCTNNGLAITTCTICDTQINSLTLNSVEHSYTSAVSNGFLVYNCTECSHSYKEEIKKEVFSVTFISDNNQVSSVAIQEGCAITYFPDVAKEGYDFVGWAIKGSNNAIYDSHCIYEDTTLVAVWEEETIVKSEYSDIAVFPSVETNFAFKVTAKNEADIKNNLAIYDLNDQKVTYSIANIGDGQFEITSNSYQPGEHYYATANGSIAFVGTESREIQFSIAGENKIEVEISSSVKWLEYSDVYGIVDTSDGQYLLTEGLFSVGDNVAIYEDTKENIVIVIKILSISQQFGYNAYTFELADYDQVFDKLEANFSGDISDGVFSVDPMAAEEIKAGFMASSTYANARSSAVQLGAMYDLQIGKETFDVSLSTKDNYIIMNFKYAIEVGENLEIVCLFNNTITTEFDYDLSSENNYSAIFTTTNKQTIQISLLKKFSNDQISKVLYEDAEDAYAQMLDKYKELLNKGEFNKPLGKSEFERNRKNYKIGGLDIRMGCVTARISLAIEVNFELSGYFGAEIEITNTTLSGMRNGKIIDSNSSSVSSIYAFGQFKLRAEGLVRIELFIHVAGVGVFGNVGAGLYFEAGVGGTISYDGYKIYLEGGNGYIDAGIHKEINIGFKAELCGITLLKMEYELMDEDESFPRMPLGSKEIWLGFDEYEKNVYINGNCDSKNDFNIDEFINIAIKYQNLDEDMIIKHKYPDSNSITYSIISVTGYRSKINLIGNKLSLDAIGEDIVIELKLKVSKTVDKTVFVHYSPTHAYDCPHDLCADGYHVGGEATCTDKAICERCGLEYGNEPIGHIFESELCIVCGAIKNSVGLEYELLENGTYAVVGIGTCESKYISIPSEYEGIPVTVIGEKAFRETDIKKVFISASITTISDFAFLSCESLLEVIFENNSRLAFIEQSVFGRCSKLQSIIIPSSVISIDREAFRWCTDLKVVIFAEGSLLEAIHRDAFYRCTSLTNIEIPASVTTIGGSAFWGCTSLASIEIPASVTTIDRDAFGNCTSLEYNEYDNAYYLGNVNNPYYALVKAQTNDISSCNIHQNTKLIVGSAFSDCTLLTSIKIPEGVISFGGRAFYNCAALMSIEIPASVTFIGYEAFYDCISLKYNEYDNAYYLGNESNPYYVLIKAKNENVTSCNIHENTQLIAGSAFLDCIYLRSIKIPYSVKYIGEHAFDDCDSVKNVTIPKNVTIIYEGAFMFSGNLRTVTFEDGSQIDAIPPVAFYLCESLRSIEIPESVTFIGFDAFYECTSLNSITFKGTMEQWNAIVKEYDWNIDIPATYVQCSDGIVYI